MSLVIKHTGEKPASASSLFIVSSFTALNDFGFDEQAIAFIKEEVAKDKKLIVLKKYGNVDFVRWVSEETIDNTLRELLRKDGFAVYDALKGIEQNGLGIYDLIGNKEVVLALTEGVALSSYAFTKYKTDAKNLGIKQAQVWVASPAINQTHLDELFEVVKAVFITRDLVNEPVSYLDVATLTSTIEALGKEHGFEVTVFNKAKIEALKFGGLLGVNKGSVDPPAFHILEWKPKNASNEKPIVLVGKGVVFDTGGINLKTPSGSLDDMKCDMGGAASVVGAFVAVAANHLPVHIIGLIPATDNRPGFNAIVPGDVLHMHNGKTVEVMNTDAEGRLILADALSYSSKYNPALVIDLATLTGSAAAAIGQYGTVAMGTASDEVYGTLALAGERVHERLVRFPFWSDYDDLIKSDVADIKNIGGREGGAITAGKFLSHFVTAPWIHLDIAGSAFVNKPDSYRGQGGTGVGVRLLYEFLKNQG